MLKEKVTNFEVKLKILKTSNFRNQSYNNKPSFNRYYHKSKKQHLLHVTYFNCGQKGHTYLYILLENFCYKMIE